MEDKCVVLIRRLVRGVNYEKIKFFFENYLVGVGERLQTFVNMLS